VIIYRILNTVNGKSYIGQTRGLFRRRYPGGKWWKYTKNFALLEDLILHGAESFEVSTLENVDSVSNLTAREHYYATILGTYYPNGYNLVQCVSGVQADGIRDRMSQAAKRRWADPAQREAIAAKHRGRPLTPDHAAAIGLANTGKKRSPETINKMKKYQQNRPQSWRDNTRQAHNKPVSCSNGQTYISAKEAAIALGVSRSKICLVCKGLRKHTKGLIFWYS